MLITIRLRTSDVLIQSLGEY